jgi:hypothetical protein
MIDRYNMVLSKLGFPGDEHEVEEVQSSTGEWVKYEDYLALLHNYDRVSTSEGFLNEELQEWKKKYYTLMEGYNLLENRVQTLSYKAYPARNGSGE